MLGLIATISCKEFLLNRKKVIIFFKLSDRLLVLYNLNGREMPLLKLFKLLCKLSH